MFNSYVKLPEGTEKTIWMGTLVMMLNQCHLINHPQFHHQQVVCLPFPNGWLIIVLTSVVDWIEASLGVLETATDNSVVLGMIRYYNKIESRNVTKAVARWSFFLL